jgi:hypothetical protein
MPNYTVKVVGQITKSFLVDDAEDEIDARNLAESEFLDDYAVVLPNGSAIPWELIESVESSEVE